MIALGSWVLATQEITEPDFMGEIQWTHALAGAVGHVLGVPDPDWVTVTWERTGTTTDCHVSEFLVLCGPELLDRKKIPDL